MSTKYDMRWVSLREYLKTHSRSDAAAALRITEPGVQKMLASQRAVYLALLEPGALVFDVIEVRRPGPDRPKWQEDAMP